MPNEKEREWHVGSEIGHAEGLLDVLMNFGLNKKVAKLY